MAEREQNFELWAGETRNLVIDVFDKNDGDSALDLAGSAVTWRLLYGATVVLTKTVGGGITLSTTVRGRMSVPISAADSNQTSGIYTHQARVVLADGNIETITIGTVVINPSAI